MRQARSVREEERPRRVASPVSAVRQKVDVITAARSSPPPTHGPTIVSLYVRTTAQLIWSLLIGSIDCGKSPLSRLNTPA